MSLNISGLKKERKFEDEKIKIIFSTGDISKALSVYLKDEKGKLYRILWEISPDRCHQSFDKTNNKIKEFVKNKISEWISDEEEAERKRREEFERRKANEESKLKRLMELF